MRRLTRSALLAGVLLCAAGPVTPLRAQPASNLLPSTSDFSSPFSSNPQSEIPDPQFPSLALENARLEEARIEYEQARSWKRLLPSVNLHASLSTRGLAFPSVTAEGYDPLYAQFQRWPGDTWGLTATWRLDQLLDRRAHARAQAALHTAEARRQLALARLEAEAATAQERQRADSLRAARRLDALTGDLRRAREEHAILADLLRLARLRFDDGEAEYEAVQRARLAVLAKEGEIARLEAEHQALHLNPSASTR